MPISYSRNRSCLFSKQNFLVSNSYLKFILSILFRLCSLVQHLFRRTFASTETMFHPLLAHLAFCKINEYHWLILFCACFCSLYPSLKFYWFYRPISNSCRKTVFITGSRCLRNPAALCVCRNWGTLKQIRTVIRY